MKMIKYVFRRKWSCLTEVLSWYLPWEKGIEEHHKSTKDGLIGALALIRT
jgi:hypothetical protein